VFYEFPDHNAIVHRLIRVLAESQIPFDLVCEQSLNRLNAYQVVIAPMLRYLDDDQVQTILAYVRNGGNLLLVDPFATEDKQARPRSYNPYGINNIPSGKYGAGRIFRTQSDDVPARRSDYWCLMEERGNAFLLAREYLNQARNADLSAGVDLGARFVRRLETELKVRLRWCSEQTDPAVYLHAYQLPGCQQRTQRIVVHLVNYHIPIIVEKGMDDQGEMSWSSVTKSGEPVVSENLQITIPLPKGLGVRHIRSLSPVESVDPIKWQTHAGQLVIRIKKLALYQAICVDLEQQ
jgi:hypothetical protein